jgi:hypothetical protein
MLQKEMLLGWCEVEHDLYEENGHVFGVELDLFNNHINFYHRQGDTYIYLKEPREDIVDAIDKFNAILAEK